MTKEVCRDNPNEIKLAQILWKEYVLNEKQESTIERVIAAGEKAVEELIKVAHDEIITDDPDDDLAADN